ncbi:MAG TPA: hypothetical protein VK621_00490 [Bradyrhizobium sp.]|nr:hypothetical protein [Bradyrhizobium sp.]
MEETTSVHGPWYKSAAPRCVNASRPIFGGAVKATEVRDHRSHYDEAKIDGATEQEVLDRKLVRGTAVVPIGNLLKK